MSRHRVSALVFCLGLLLLWETGVRLAELPGYILPPPSAIAMTAVVRAPVIFPHAAATMAEILAGIGLALATAVPLAVAMFARPGLEKGAGPFSGGLPGRSRLCPGPPAGGLAGLRHGLQSFHGLDHHLFPHHHLPALGSEKLP